MIFLVLTCQEGQEEHSDSAKVFHNVTRFVLLNEDLINSRELKEKRFFELKDVNARKKILHEKRITWISSVL